MGEQPECWAEQWAEPTARHPKGVASRVNWLRLRGALSNQEHD